MAMSEIVFCFVMVLKFARTVDNESILYIYIYIYKRDYDQFIMSPGSHKKKKKKLSHFVICAAGFQRGQCRRHAA